MTLVYLDKDECGVINLRHRQVNTIEEAADFLYHQARTHPGNAMLLTGKPYNNSWEDETSGEWGFYFCDALSDAWGIHSERDREETARREYDRLKLKYEEKRDD